MQIVVVCAFSQFVGRYGLITNDYVLTTTFFLYCFPPENFIRNRSILCAVKFLLETFYFPSDQPQLPSKNVHSERSTRPKRIQFWSSSKSNLDFDGIRFVSSLCCFREIAPTRCYQTTICVAPVSGTKLLYWSSPRDLDWFALPASSCMKSNFGKSCINCSTGYSSNCCYGTPNVKYFDLFIFHASMSQKSF